jgi:hypothetical protein
MADPIRETTVSPEASALVSALVDGACEWQHHRDRWTGNMDGSEVPPGADMINAPRDALLAYIAKLEAVRGR